MVKTASVAVEPLTVLLVDDVNENLELLEEVLSENGYRSLLAKNGLDALELLQERQVHLIVADAMMPRMDGFQLCKEVKANPAHLHTPFIIYTGDYVDGTDEEFARSIGVDRYIVKYAGLGTLVEAVNDLVSQRYGVKIDVAAGEPEKLGDQEFLQKHHAIIVKKLEEKMSELEVYAETLVRKNREIEASEDRYRSLFEQASIAIYVADGVSGKILEANHQGLELLGLSKEELVGMSGLPLQEANDFTAGMLTADHHSSGEATLLTKSGESIEVEIDVGPVFRPRDNRILLYVRDVREEKRMRDRLIQAEKLTLMGRLAAGIAHDIRNPLSAITLNLQYLRQKCKEDASLGTTIEDALEGTRRVEAVIENTLNMARTTPPVLKQSAINDIVTQVLGFLKLPVQQKSLQVHTILPEGLPPVYVDTKQIQQVIINVLQNAVDASAPGATVSVSSGALEVASSDGLANPSRVFVTIKDTGVGITPEQYKHLFEHFRSGKPGGTGLGLALSKQIMDRHNADIRIEPAVGGGTMVRLVFPIHHQEKR